jgi:hypothetical protein
MGHRPLNCQNDDTPHVFPSQLAEVERLEAARQQLLDAARGYMDMVVEERDNNERLRAAGNAFTEWWHFGDIENLDEFIEAVLAWQEARRG